MVCTLVLERVHVFIIKVVFAKRAALNRRYAIIVGLGYDNSPHLVDKRLQLMSDGFLLCRR